MRRISLLDVESGGKNLGHRPYAQYRNVDLVIDVVEMHRPGRPCLFHSGRLETNQHPD